MVRVGFRAPGAQPGRSEARRIWLAGVELVEQLDHRKSGGSIAQPPGQFDEMTGACHTGHPRTGSRTGTLPASDRPTHLPGWRSSMIPIGDDPPARRLFPIVTLTLIAINVVVFIYELSLGNSIDALFRSAGVVPREFL